MVESQHEDIHDINIDGYINTSNKYRKYKSKNVPFVI